MRIDNNLTVTQLGGDYMAVPVGEAAERFHGVIRLNTSAAFIIDCLRTETTEDEIIDKMLARYEAERGVIASDVEKTLRRLREIGMLEE